MDELASVLEELDRDVAVRAIVLGGSERAFAPPTSAAGGRSPRSSSTTSAGSALGRDSRVGHPRRGRLGLLPAAAAAGDGVRPDRRLRVGGVRAARTGLGIIPGAGGTQRLSRAVGKALAMDVILSGRRLSAREAHAAGLVARVVAKEAWLDEAKRVARAIAEKGPVATRLAKESVDRAFESTLATGLEAERRALYLAFASEDAKEGLTAFTEKRKPEFKGR